MFQLPDLPYEYAALEPHIDEQTMRIHHDKHFQSYLDKFNAAVEKHPDLFEKSTEEILGDLEAVPEDVRTAVRNNGGGYYHHRIFFEMMSPDGGEMSEEVKTALVETFGSVDEFKKRFSEVAGTHFASGWTWLVKQNDGKLAIISTPNQDSPLTMGLTPLLGIDTWEHAYYLKFQNCRPEYIQSWWNVVNWGYVNQKFNS